jgi:hypothetical protein
MFANLACVCFLTFFVASCSLVTGDGQVREGCVDENTARGYTADYARDICEGEFLMYGNNRSPLDEASDDLESATSYFDCMTKWEFDPEWEDFCQRISEPVSGSAATPNTLSPTTIAITIITTTTVVIVDTVKEACKQYNYHMAKIDEALDANVADGLLVVYNRNWQVSVKGVVDALSPLGRISQKDVDPYNALVDEKGIKGPYGEMYREGDIMVAKWCFGN